jgi:nudix-type nucleoside diphosphatase (YffH/AdpP family)
MVRLLRADSAYAGYAKVSILTMADDRGRQFQREVVSIGESTCVLPYDAERKLALMVRLPRAPLIASGVEAELLEAPAGMIDPGETPQEAARREALEETGVVLGALEPVAVCWPSPGVLAERSHLFLARYRNTDVRYSGGGLAEEHEAIIVEETPLGELWRSFEAGRLQDMKTLALVLALRSRRPELFPPD